MLNPVAMYSSRARANYFVSTVKMSDDSLFCPYRTLTWPDIKIYLNPEVYPTLVMIDVVYIILKAMTTLMRLT